MMPANINTFKSNVEVTLDLDKTGIIEFKKPSTHEPDYEKADLLEAMGRSYQMLWESTGKKCYKDSMDACFGDAKDYRSCGFVRPLGASV